MRILYDILDLFKDVFADSNFILSQLLSSSLVIIIVIRTYYILKESVIPFNDTEYIN